MFLFLSMHKTNRRLQCIHVIQRGALAGGGQGEGMFSLNALLYLGNCGACDYLN
jgi:hypothetical protein